MGRLDCFACVGFHSVAVSNSLVHFIIPKRELQRRRILWTFHTFSYLRASELILKKENAEKKMKEKWVKSYRKTVKRFIVTKHVKVTGMRLVRWNPFPCNMHIETPKYESLPFDDLPVESGCCRCDESWIKKLRMCSGVKLGYPVLKWFSLWLRKSSSDVDLRGCRLREQLKGKVIAGRFEGITG